MVPRHFILIALAASLAACKSDHDREVDAARVTIWDATHRDWRIDIPLVELVHAEQLCKKYGALAGCDAVTDQLNDISTSLSSCANDMRSRLCREIVALFKKSPLAYLVSATKPVPLPDVPWFWTMPTTMLDVLADDFGYRREVANWWWEQWHRVILWLLTAAILSSASWLSVKHLRRHQWTQMELASRQKAEQEAEERSRRAAQEKLQAETNARARAESQRRSAEQQRIAAEQLAQAQLAEKLVREKNSQDKLASEQAEVQKLLGVAFSNTVAHKRRKNDTASE